MPIKSVTDNSLTEAEDYHDGCLSSNLIMLRSRGENIQFITKLNLWGLKLKHVSMLKCMPNLKIINMSSNCLQSLESFATCLNLCELYLRNNHIKNINEVGHLKYLHKLEKLWLNGNPCCDYFKIYDKNDTIQCNNASMRYRCTVIRNLQRLVHLDQEEITSEERELSEEYGIFLIAPPPQQTFGEQCHSELSDSTLTNIDQNNTEESTNTQSVIDITLSSDVEMKRQEHHSHLSVTKNDSQINNTNALNELISINGIEEVVNNNNVNIKSPCIKRKCHNRSYLQDVTLKETNKIRQEYGLKPINKNKISSPAKRFQPTDRKNEKIVRNSVIRLLRTLNYDSLERIIQAAEKRLLRLTGLTNSLKLQSLLVNEDNVEDNDNEWTPNGTYDCSNYMNDNK
ncbi:Protein C21orf2 isoform 2 [Schistosoma japonicum]|uniref:Protein C21orf2 isoform 2 n=2 Tax=Schistosoma japonicum TaxID=6182 RepID=A0A4Z2DF14_SCHJA|nr:Protein C21orf2 isoform 2 [Schistosoma japonicum]TNN14821.1 Protein C21orf2 isoform 2 [Schistosoma japonicum]